MNQRGANPRRQDLAWLWPAAWESLACAEGRQEVVKALRVWALQQWPCVVAAQHGAPAGTWRLGLPLPPSWGKQRVALHVPPDAVSKTGRFPSAQQVAAALAPSPAGAALKQLACQLAAAGADAQVFGSHGWQHITALPYTCASSDLDLLVDVPNAQVADAAALQLAAAPAQLPRLDGELRFADGTAVAWREWHVWRGLDGHAAPASGILVRQPAGPAVHHNLNWLAVP
jgi:phosphoribosyl-dephospho-CoA transferase